MMHTESPQAPVELQDGGYRYRWHEDWCRLPASSRSNGRTHSVAHTGDGRVVVFQQADPAVLIFDTQGKPVDAFGDYPGAHGMTLVVDAWGRESLWLTDQGSAVVHQRSLDGELLMQLPSPPGEVIAQASNPKYVPTWVAVGPDGDLWVADGYGTSFIFRYDARGQFKAFQDGQDAAGRYACPHGIAFDAKGQLWIADRGNKRVIVCDAQGQALRHSDSACHSPCMFDFHDDLIYVPELYTGVKLLDAELNVKASLGADADIDLSGGRASRPADWPNRPRARLSPGKFNSPHGLGVGADGSIFVGEWIAGGRVTKLEPIEN